MLWSELSQKKALTVLGLSSGTSADGVDVALVEISRSKAVRVKQLAFSVYKYPAGLSQKILELSSAKTYALDQIAYLNYALGEFFAEAALEFLKKRKAKADLIGSHGQTIRHLPVAKTFYGQLVKATWQIGEGDVIAKRIGLVTVSDFRAGDLAAGGQGAPLTPYTNYLLLGNQRTTAVLNIGGIANISAWKKGASPKEILGFDCGPGNMVVDQLVKMLLNKNYDKNGKIALSGKVHQKLLLELKKHKFFKRRPPKSTGREEFGEEFVRRVLTLSSRYKLSTRDLIATLSELTIQAVRDSYRRFILPSFEVERLLVTGGGIHNHYFLKRLKKLFEPVKISNPQEYGYSPKALEAISFAVLAYLAVHNIPADLPQITGARRRAILGKISLP